MVGPGGVCDLRRPARAVAIMTAMARGAEARLFVALDLPAEARGELVVWARAAAACMREGGLSAARGPSVAYRGVVRSPGRRRESRPLPTRQPRLLGNDTLHVTLCFLGSRPAGEIDALDDVLAMACAEASPVGELSFGAPLWLPPRHPRTLAVELHDTPDRTLEALHRALAAALAEVCESGMTAANLPTGLGVDGRMRRRFRPHVTVARMRPSEAPSERGLPPTPQLSFTPRTVTLHRSWLTPKEAVYEGLATYSLAAPAE
jgi:RNA 2',3'-cyclic 3'-phosphodiesterase